MSPKSPEKSEPPRADRPRDMIRVRALEALERIRQQAEETGAANLTEEEIQAEIDAVRAEKRAKIEEAVAALRAVGREADERALSFKSREELEGLVRVAREELLRRPA